MKALRLCTLRAPRGPRLPRCIALTVCLFAFVAAAFSQTLSQNSGINPQDTHAVFDLSVQSTGTVTLPSAVYNPSTQTMSTVFNVSPLARTMHVEAGYDTNGGMVINLYLNPTTASSYTTSISPVGVVRYAQGQITLFDTNNVPIPQVLPNSGMSALLPPSFVNSNTGGSLLGQLAVSDIRHFAAVRNAVLNLQGSSATVSLPSGPGPQVVWTYAQSGSTWVPQQVQIAPSMANGSVTHRLQFSNLAVFDNAAADAARASQPATLQSPPPSNNNAAPQFAPTPEFAISCPGNPGQEYQQYQLGGSQNIAFQHGFMSDPSTWVRMVPWLNQDFIFGTEVVSATDWCSNITDQAGAPGTPGTLEGELSQAGGSNYILVAHSMGGLVARKAAQNLQNTPTPVYGVVTMNTPNQGVDLAINGAVEMGVAVGALSNAMYGWMGCGSDFDNIGCFAAALGANGAGTIAASWGESTIGAVRDGTPGSGFLDELNNPQQPENFRQAGVVAYTPQRWLFTREPLEMFFGSQCWPDSNCGEEVVAADTEFLYDGAETNMLADILIEDFCAEEDLNCPEAYTNLLDEQINFDAGLMGWMNAIDGVYDTFMGCNFQQAYCEGSDGLVQFSSQVYPNMSPNGLEADIYGADAHGGATKSNYDHAAMDWVLSQWGVQQPSTCTYTTSTSSITLPASGGAGSFNVTTSPGCQWSATSKQYWLSVDNQTGTGNGTVNFSVQPDQTNMSLQGVITVGSAWSTTNVNITLSGVCSYSLTPGPVISIPGTGGTGTISVNTQTGCVWSAVSSAPSWLAITGPATGTGPGSFEYNAAASTGGGYQSATITVAGQILTVNEGTTSGAPGTGTVTIIGSPQSTTVNECPGNPHGPCMANVQEGGAVVVWVNGMSYSAYYPPNESAASLAVALEAEMNSPSSPIIATVAGSTITITATVNGAATNYPLSTSYGFNTSNFSSPAFQAIASGPSLTGGHN